VIENVPVDDPRTPAIDKQCQEQRQTLTVCWLDRMATARARRVEKLTWFWHRQWATSMDKVGDPGLMLAQNQTLRRQGQDSVAALARTMVVDPALVVV
jgi:hypothetical protein